jgi:DNA-binding transcriptional LysR family regulator
MIIAMELREMKSLIALSECGSIRDAGLRCNLCPAAIHKHLKTLESDFGVPIYVKRNGSLVLTEAGQILLPFLREILLRHESAFLAMEEWKDAKRGMVRVGAGPTFSSYLLPSLVKQFRRRFPKVDVFVETGDSAHLMDGIRSGTLDLAFDLASAALEDENLEQVAVWESQAGFVSALPKLPRYCQLKALQSVPFILFQEGSPMGVIVRNYLNALNFRPNVIMRSDSAEAIKSMVRAGLGISVLFLWNIDVDLQKSRFAVIQTEAPLLVSRISLIRLKGAYTSHAVTEFVGLARKVGSKHLRLVKPTLGAARGSL